MARIPVLRRLIAAIRGKRYLYRSAITGRYVSKAFADENPATTYRVEARR